MAKYAIIVIALTYYEFSIRFKLSFFTASP